MSGRVIVIGSINVDTFIIASRHPMTDETLYGEISPEELGGKGANQAIAASRSGAITVLIAALGNTYQDFVRHHLLQEKVEFQPVGVSNKPTGRAVVYALTSGETSCIISQDCSNADLSAECVASLIFDRKDIVVAQWETPLATTLAAFTEAKSKGATTIWNAAPVSSAEYAIRGNLMARVTDILVVNEIEAGQLSAKNAPRSSEEVALCGQMLKSQGYAHVVTTLGDKGLVLVSNEFGHIEIPAIQVEVVDSTCAGDCLTGNLAAALARGETLPEALRFATAASSLCVQKKGSSNSMPHRDETAALCTEIGDMRTCGHPQQNPFHGQVIEA